MGLANVSTADDGPRVSTIFSSASVVFFGSPTRLISEVMAINAGNIASTP